MEYDIKNIRQLCERYFDGEASAEEEMVLRSYFLETADVPEDLKSVKVMICGFREAASMTYRPADAAHRQPGKVRRLVWAAASVAAAAALCIGLFRKEVYGYDADGNIITDPHVALEGTSCLAYLDNLQTSIDIAQMITSEMENDN